MKDIEKILHRIKEALDLKRDKDIAEKLGVNQNTLASWKNRDTIDYPLLIEFCNKYKLSLDFILNGQGNPYLEVKNDDKKDENLFVQENKNEYIAKLENELKKTDAENGIVRKEIAQENIELEELKRRLTILEMLVVKGKNI